MNFLFNLFYNRFLYVNQAGAEWFNDNLADECFNDYLKSMDKWLEDNNNKSVSNDDLQKQHDETKSEFMTKVRIFSLKNFFKFCTSN